MAYYMENKVRIQFFVVVTDGLDAKVKQTNIQEEVSLGEYLYNI